MRCLLALLALLPCLVAAVTHSYDVEDAGPLLLVRAPVRPRAYVHPTSPEGGNDLVRRSGAGGDAPHALKRRLLDAPLAAGLARRAGGDAGDGAGGSSSSAGKKPATGKKPPRFRLWPQKQQPPLDPAAKAAARAAGKAAAKAAAKAMAKEWDPDANGALADPNSPGGWARMRTSVPPPTPKEAVVRAAAAARARTLSRAQTMARKTAGKAGSAGSSGAGPAGDGISSAAREAAARADAMARANAAARIAVGPTAGTVTRVQTMARMAAAAKAAAARAGGAGGSGAGAGGGGSGSGGHTHIPDLNATPPPSPAHSGGSP